MCNVLSEKAIGDIIYTVGLFDKLQSTGNHEISGAFSSLFTADRWDTEDADLLHIIQELLQRQQQSHKQ